MRACNTGRTSAALPSSPSTSPSLPSPSLDCDGCKRQNQPLFDVKTKMYSLTLGADPSSFFLHIIEYRITISAWIQEKRAFIQLYIHSECRLIYHSMVCASLKKASSLNNTSLTSTSRASPHSFSLVNKGAMTPLMIGVHPHLVEVFLESIL